MIRRTAVLFDLEDTLVETPWSKPEHRLEFRRDTRQRLIELGIPSAVLEGVERATIMRNKASEYVEHNFETIERTKFNREIGEFLRRYEMDSANDSRLFGDTVPALRKLERLNAEMGLVTNTSAEAVEVIFQKFRLKRFFKAVITRENVKKLKPDPEGLLMAVKRLGTSDFFMVGDLVLDVLAAKKANGKCILVRRPQRLGNSSGLYISLPVELLEDAKGMLNEENGFGADYVIESLLEIPEIIRNSNG